ncbi:MAG: hypothetical protein ACPGQL_06015 [Thermoplasmatota archaeon]
MNKLAILGAAALMLAVPATAQFGVVAGSDCDVLDVAGLLYITADDYIYEESNGEAGLQRDAAYEAQYFNNGCYDADETNPDGAIY